MSSALAPASFFLGLSDAFVIPGLCGVRLEQTHSRTRLAGEATGEPLAIRPEDKLENGSHHSQLRFKADELLSFAVPWSFHFADAPAKAWRKETMLVKPDRLSDSAALCADGSGTWATGKRAGMDR